MTDATLQRFAPPTLADMRAALDDCWAGRVKHCVNGVWVTLERADKMWQINLLSAGRCLSERQAREFAVGVGAPDGVTLTEDANGAKWAGGWED
jgi:hypothetical protein